MHPLGVGNTEAPNHVATMGTEQLLAGVPRFTSVPDGVGRGGGAGALGVDLSPGLVGLQAALIWRARASGAAAPPVEFPLQVAQALGQVENHRDPSQIHPQISP